MLEDTVDTVDTVAERVEKVCRVVPTGSKFTWRNFMDLNVAEKSHNTPLLVIAHVDVNAFFAQLEQLRLGLSSSDPVVCVQWNSLIAVSYALRNYGISRMDSLQSARAKCPNVIAAHTAVFRKGDPYWSYRDAGVLPNSDTHKVSLDPYRRESRKMMRIFRSKCDKVEKASVDESFMDFGRLIYQKALELFPMLRDMKDPDQMLPQIPNEIPILEFKGEVIGNETEDANTIEINDWDDVFIMIGSQILHDIRKEIESELGYTTSCGVSRLKTISKLASGFIKPDHQTIVRASAIANFCDNFEISDFWSMGGKVGKMIQLKLMTPTEGSNRFIRDNYTMDELRDRLKPDTSLPVQLYKMVRGELYSPLNMRTDVKSMASSKNFRGKQVSSMKDIEQWMPVFCGDILQRMQELDEESGILSGDTSNRIIRRPKTVSIDFRISTCLSFSRQCSIPLVTSIEKVHDLIYKNSTKLAQNVEETWNEFAHGELFPITHFGIAISNFEEMDCSRSIDEFALKGKDTHEVINSMFLEFTNNQSSVSPTQTPKPIAKTKKKPEMGRQQDIFQQVASIKKRQEVDNLSQDPTYCENCRKNIVDEDMMSHRDYHMALELSKQYSISSSQMTPEPQRPNKKRKKLDKGQSTLPFMK